MTVFEIHVDYLILCEAEIGVQMGLLCSTNAVTT
jgi:hypothetical protein